VEQLGGEALVYDVERNEAHALRGAAAAEFMAAGDEVSRRQVLRRLALAGAAAAGAGAMVKTIVAPTPAQAQTACVAAGGNCTTAGDCCAQANATVQCTGSPTVCQFTCNAGFGNCTNAPGCETNLMTTKQHCGACGAGCTGSQNCVGGVCTSDRHAKREFLAADPARVLAAL
jgi:hypothetical protein